MTTWHEHLLAVCRTDAEREAVLRDVLNQSRIAAGFDYVVRPVAPEIAPRSFKESKRQVILAALTKHNGNKSHAAAELGISRNTIHEYIRVKPVKNVIRLAQVAAVLLMLALTGCAVPTPRPAPPMPMRSTAPQASNLSSQSVMPSAQNVLVWDAPFTDPRLNSMLRYRIAARTNLSAGSWVFTTVTGTNRLELANKPAEFFTISRVDYAPATNVFITRKGF